MAEENSTVAMNETHECLGEFDAGFNLLFITVPLNAIIISKTALVILTMYRTPSLYSNANIIMSSLSLSDVLLGTSYFCISDSKSLIVYVSVEKMRVIKAFVYGEWTSSILISFGHMANIAIDRYVLIAHPFYHIKRMTTRRTYISLLCVWIMGLFVLFIPVTAYSHGQYNPYCIVLQPPLEYYILCVSMYCSTCLIVLVSYLKIAILAFAHKKATNARRLQNGNCSSDVLKTNRTAAFRSVKFFAMMFGVFITCTFPTAIIAGLAEFYTIPHYIYFCATYLVLLNSFISFAIYFRMNTAFSKAMKKTCSDLLSCIRK